MRRSRKAAPSPRDILRAAAPEAIGVLTAVMRDEGLKPELRIKAAESILDRACGKTVSDNAAGTPVDVRFEGVLEEWSR